MWHMGSKDMLLTETLGWTFLLQDSLGGNSKTMIIANVTPSICSTNETLSTLKFAQRARLGQNNVVVNEDASGDISALQCQIRLLKEELSLLKRQNVSRSLSFRAAVIENSKDEDLDTSVMEDLHGSAQLSADELNKIESCESVRVSTKQLKSLETTLACDLRREKMEDTTIKQLEAEIEQLNRLLKDTSQELEKCKDKLNSYMETNARLTRDMNNLHVELTNIKSACHGQLYMLILRIWICVWIHPHSSPLPHTRW